MHHVSTISLGIIQVLKIDLKRKLIMFYILPFVNKTQEKTKTLAVYAKLDVAYSSEPQTTDIVLQK